MHKSTSTTQPTNIFLLRTTTTTTTTTTAAAATTAHKGVNPDLGKSRFFLEISLSSESESPFDSEHFDISCALYGGLLV